MTALPAIDFVAPYAKARADKLPALLEGLSALTTWHQERCSEYAAMLAAVFGSVGNAEQLADVPFLPVRAFKHLDLRSVPREAVTRVLTSSGTTGQQVSRVSLDAETSALQVRALAAIMQEFIGPTRRPMLIVDQAEVLRGQAAFSARAAGILGFSTFGRQPVYALDAEMKPRWEAIDAFLEAHRGKSVLVFGFTWVVWQCFLSELTQSGRTLDFGPDSLLIHGGGWKKLADQCVDNATFKRVVADATGIGRVSNYYGMVEQVGSVFMECEEGYLHTPTFADVLMRDPLTLAPSESGVVEVVSLLPRSYPGHALLTEDLVTVLGEDDGPCGRKGKRFMIHGRIPMAELRGCSDVRGL